LRVVIRDFEVDRNVINRLHDLRLETEFLFGNEMVAYIQDWIAHAANSHVAAPLLPVMPLEHEDRNMWVEKYHTAAEFFHAQFENMVQMFRPYLRVPLHDDDD
jgi:hypothetical protein